MFNILIIEDDAIQCKQLVNFISSSITDLKLYSMTFNGNEALEIIKNKKIDIIILDLLLPDISGLNILQYIEENKLSNYKNSIIIISGEANQHPELFRNEYVNYCFQKPVNFDLILKCLQDMINEKNKQLSENIIKEKIYKELEKLRYNFSHIGTHYLCECIFELYLNKDNIMNLSKNVYSVIAQRHSTTINNVKCNIFQANLNSYYECEEVEFDKYFNFNICCKPKNIDVITTVLEHLKN